MIDYMITNCFGLALETYEWMTAEESKEGDPVFKAYEGFLLTLPFVKVWIGWEDKDIVIEVMKGDDKGDT